MAFSNFKKAIFGDEDDRENENLEEEFYSVSEKSLKDEARAYSESQTIAEHLKKRNSVVVNLKRVTSDQAKRIIDFLTGCIYAIGGDLQKLGNGIYLCTPKNVSVQGKMTDQDAPSKKVEDEIDF